MKPVFVFCEGHHDIGFASHVFSANGATPFEDVLADYLPESLSRLLVNHYSRRDAAAGKFRYKGSNRGAFVVDAPPILTTSWKLSNPDRLFLFFRCHGDSYKNSVPKFLDGVVNLSIEKNPDITLGPIGVIFTTDADQDGIAKRVADCQKHFGDVLNPIVSDLSQLSANAPDGLVKNDDNTVGCFVFCEPESDKGTLEDILIPQFKSVFDDRFNDAEEFVKKFSVDGTKVTKGANPDARKLKAAMTIAGQIDSPGYALTVVLRDTDAFSKEFILENNSCKEFWDFICAI